MGVRPEAMTCDAGIGDRRREVRPSSTRGRDADAVEPCSGEAKIAVEWIGRVIGRRHRIIRHIASGGMGHVFLAQHATLGGYMVIKILPAGSDSVSTRYFGNEARFLSRLRHPNVVSVFDYATMKSGDRYIVMEWLPGFDLGGFVAVNGPLKHERVLWIITQLASAVDYVHGQGILHRDIKPDNVMIRPDAYDMVKLLDFGVAVATGPPPKSELSKLIGTPQYMAPEQAEGLPAGQSTDLYGLGALTLELLTGRAPYELRSPAEVIYAVRTSAPRAPSDSGVQVLGLDALIAHSLCRDPICRFASGRQFVTELRDVLRAKRGRNALSQMAVTPLPPNRNGTIVMPDMKAHPFI